MSEFVNSPMKPIASPPSSYGPTGPGTCNGEEGLPKRTSTPNGPPEKIRDGSVKGPDKSDFSSSSGK